MLGFLEKMGRFSSSFCHETCPVDRVSDFGVKPRCGSPPDDWSRFQKWLKFSFCRYQQAIFCNETEENTRKNVSDYLLGMVAVVQHKPVFPWGSQNRNEWFPSKTLLPVLTFSTLELHTRWDLYHAMICRIGNLEVFADLIGYSCIFQDWSARGKLKFWSQTQGFFPHI